MIDPSELIEKVRIEQMRMEDLDEVMIIEKASFITPWTRGMFIEELGSRHSVCLVARMPDESGSGENGKIIGFVCSSFILDEIHILNIAVHPSYRRKGVAGLMIKEIIKKGYERGSRYIFLEVRVKNKAAIRFYEKLGFKVIGLRKGYYADTGEDALIMEKELMGVENI